MQKKSKIEDYAEQVISEYAERLHSAVSNIGSANIHDVINDEMEQMKIRTRQKLVTI